MSEDSINFCKIIGILTIMMLCFMLSIVMPGLEVLSNTEKERRDNEQTKFVNSLKQSNVYNTDIKQNISIKEMYKWNYEKE